MSHQKTLTSDNISVQRPLTYSLVCLHLKPCFSIVYHKALLKPHTVKSCHGHSGRIFSYDLWYSNVSVHSLYNQAGSKQTMLKVNVLITFKFLLVDISCFKYFETISNKNRTCIAMTLPTQSKDMSEHLCHH